MRASIQNKLIPAYQDDIVTSVWFNGHSHLRGINHWTGIDRQVVRDQIALLNLVVPIQCALPFGYAVIMPNLPVPNTRGGEALCYSQTIGYKIPPGVQFERVMAIQVHMGTTPEIIADAYTEGGRRYKAPPRVRLAKLYLEKVTNSPIGVAEADIFCDQMMLAFEELAKWGMILSVHPEVFRGEGELFSCEKAFIPILEKLARRLSGSGLVISVEHISTRELLEAVLALDNVVGSFTIHHLIGDTAEFWRDGAVYDPFNFCRSVLRKYKDRSALLMAIADPVKRHKLFLGLDDAPHLRSAKLEKGSPGIWIPAPFAASLFLEICEAYEIPLEAVIEVACLNGPRIYGLTIPDREVRFTRADIVIPDLYPIGGGAPIYGDVPDDIDGVVPYLPRHLCRWQIVPDA